MKSRPLQLAEGSGAFDRFRDAIKAVLSVSKDDLPPRPSRKKKKAARRKP